MPTSPDRYRNDSRPAGPERVGLRPGAEGGLVVQPDLRPRRSPGWEWNSLTTSTSRQPRFGASRTGPIIRSTSPGTARQLPAIRRSVPSGPVTSQYSSESRRITSTGSLPRKSADSTCWPSDRAGQVDHPHAEVVDVDLHADGGQGALRRGSAGRRAGRRVCDITGGSSATSAAMISRSASDETVARVNPVATAMSAREGGTGASMMSLSTRPRLCSRRFA